jgi:hypothetical protein
MVSRPTIALCAVLGLAAPAIASSPFASTVISYNAGTGSSPAYQDPAAALGSPARFTGESFGFDGAVTPFNAPFEPDEIVQIGRGGHLTLGFDHDVADDALNPFGIDLLVFSNAFYIDSAFPGGVASGVFGGNIGAVSVSQDGTNFVPVLSVGPVRPTLGYADLTDPYAATPGLVPTDFTRPVDPTFDPTGQSFASIVAAYNGSGGGIGIDLAGTGLSWIRFIRFDVASTGPLAVIDGVSDVAPIPAPGALALLLLAASVGRGRGRGAR